MSIALLGGTGLRHLTNLVDATTDSVTTPYGTVTLTRGSLAARDVVFLCRHGEQGQTPPHRINYRANVAALQLTGVRAVIATTAVGSLDHRLAPGAFALCDQFLDFTKTRATTFFDTSPAGPVHIDLTTPFCPRLRALLEEVAAKLPCPLAPAATYACAEGPRFETPSEIRMMRQLGAEVVGMTLVPEVVLAREAGLCYANVSVVTNWAAGISPTPLSHREVIDLMRHRNAALLQLLEGVVARFEPFECSCREALADYGFTFGEFLRA